MTRRSLLELLLSISLLVAGCGLRDPAQIRFDQVKEYSAPQSNRGTLRVGVVTVLSPRESFDAYRNLADYLGEAVGVPADLVLRKSYAELNDLVRTSAVDMALVGFGGYEAGVRQFGMEGLVTGQVDGSTEADALLLIRADSHATQLQDRVEVALRSSGLMRSVMVE